MYDGGLTINTVCNNLLNVSYILICAPANIHSDKFLALVNYLYGSGLETPTLNKKYYIVSSNAFPFKY